MGLTVPLQRDELEHIIDYFLAKKTMIGLFWAAVISYQYLTGARISEINHLRRHQIADNDCRLHNVMTRAKLKTRKKQSTHTVYLDPDSSAAVVVSTWLEVSRNKYGRFTGDDWAFAWAFSPEPFRRESAWRAYQRAYHALGMDYVSRGTHAIRKTSAVSEYEIAFGEYGDGMRALQIVQRFLGHVRIDTTQAYLPVNPGFEDLMARQHGSKIKTSNSLRQQYLSHTYQGSTTTQPV